MNNPSLELKQIVHQYDDHRVLNNIHLKLELDAPRVIRGRNGAGKTTLLRIAGNLLFPTSGQINYQEINPNSQIGWVSADGNGLIWNLTGQDNLKFFARMRKIESIDATIKAFRQFEGFEQALKTPFEACSMGMRKLLCTANATLHQPKLLILDEPLNHLDEINQRLFIEKINNWKSATLILVASHSSAFETFDSLQLESEPPH